jgi:YidC/Oxa1 family membrane protein insertase
MHVTLATVLLAENSLFHTIGEIFQPVFKLFATILAFIYGIIPNYAIAIAVLTIIIMGALTPLTVKGTKNMMAMQAIQPELKKLQQKYKGAENREQLNQEMMRLYKEHNVNPAAGCLPLFLQMPFLFILYDVIKGLTNTISNNQVFPAGTPNAGQKCHEALCAVPRYIPTSSKMYEHLVATPGVMKAFGMNLADKPFSHHGSVWAAIPFFVFVAIAVVLQFVQMRQMSSRNPQAAQANPQMATMQKFMPILFAYIYFLIPAAVVIYMIVSSSIRIATQDIIFRTGMVKLPSSERAIPAKSTPQKPEVVTKPPPKKSPTGSAALAKANNAAGTRPPKKGTPPKRPAPRPGVSGTATNGNGNGKGSSNGSAGTTNGTTSSSAQSRAKNKRPRKDR